MDWKTAQIQTGGSLNVPTRWLYLHYYEALNILFRTENALRVFVYIVLKNSVFDKWADTSMQVSEAELSTIGDLAKKRIAQAQGFGYLGYEITSPLMHLNSGELVRLITSDKHWSIFKSYFKGKRDIIRNKLDEVSTVRNSLAHFRPIKSDDIELIKQNVKHALIGVEECLSEMTQTYNIVPTNTKEDWYANLKPLGTDLCEIQLFQSNGEEWIRLQITFSSKILKKEQWWAGNISYTVLNLVSPAIINHYRNVRKYVTYVTEYIPHAKMNDELMPAFKKAVSFVFRKDILALNQQDIVADVKNMLLKVQEEAALVEQDNLARGDLIETARAAARLKEADGKKTWITDSDNLPCPFGEDDPTEYWGDVGLYHNDFIAGVSKYPWMPSNISEGENIFD